MADQEIAGSIFRLPITRRRFVLSAVGGAASALLAACGGSDSTPSPSDSSEAPSPTTGSAGASSPASTASSTTPATTTASGGNTPAATGSAPGASKPSGSVTIGLDGEPNSLDPLFANGATEYNVELQVMNGLFTTGKSSDQADVSPVPDLVEKWEVIDPQTWEFRLRKDAVFADGTPLTAEAVKASYERSADESLHVRRPWKKDLNTAEIKVVDDYTVQFLTSAPTGHMLARLAIGEYVWPPDYIANTDPQTIARKPVGSGPYIFQNWTAGEQIELKANPKYWGNPKPSIDSVVFRFIPEDGTRVSSLEAGDVDLISNLPPALIDRVKSNDKLDVITVEGSRRVFVGLNCQMKPTDDVRVRQALNYGIDVDSICKTIMGGTTTRMTNWVERAFRDPNVKGYTYDPDKAKQLLKEAGYGDGVEVTFDYQPTGEIGISEFPQAIAAQLREIGVDVKLQTFDPKIMTDRRVKREMDQLWSSSYFATFDPGLTFDLFHPENSNNATLWNDPDFQKLLDEMWTLVDDKERLQLSYKMQAALMEQAPVIFLWNRPEIYGINKRLLNFKPIGDERTRMVECSLAE